jgi:hypothetical protein
VGWIWVEIVGLHGCRQYKATMKFLGYTHPCAQHCQHKNGNSLAIPMCTTLPTQECQFLGYTHVHNIANTRMAIPWLYPCAQHCQHKNGNSLAIPMCTTLPTQEWQSYDWSFTHKPYTYPCAQHCQHKDVNPIIHPLPINPIHTHVHNIANIRMAIL